MNISTIITLAILTIINVAVYIWAFLLFRNLKKCENSESAYCPGLYCQTKDTDCGHNAFRIEDGTKICQSYLITERAPTVTSTA